ncbi:unnamed protein product [Colletotrichum noveboracense]|uniref:Uncharacterized protein n=1 Tax=Colletotrichum noveboracense TaxID=2664923 RepID=A0A9W4S245_9PEZI|nr:unnamed protein product [Colletotrichum noveboracense]
MTASRTLGLRESRTLSPAKAGLPGHPLVYPRQSGCTQLRKNLSYFLGVKSASDPQDWSPCRDVVQETTEFAMSTERLDA